MTCLFSTMAERPANTMRKSTVRNDAKVVQDDKCSDRPSLRSLALPWASMVIVAVLATALVVYQNHHDEEEAFVFATSNGSMRQIASTNESILERLLSAAHPVEQHHVHKPVYVEEHASLFPLTTADRLGFSLAIVGLMVAAGGGIGGGGILVPIYILVMGFSPKHGA